MTATAAPCRFLSISFSLLCVGVCLARAAFEPLPAGARAAALCGATPPGSAEPLSAAANPSLLSSIAGPVVEFSFVPGLFGMKELRLLDAAVAFPLGSVGAGCQVRSFGGPLYREISMTASVAGKLSGRSDGGISLTLYHLAIAGYGTAAACALSAGARVRLADPLRFAMSVRNINRPHLGKAREPIGTELQAALQYDPAAWLHLIAGLSKEERTPPAAMAGLEADLAAGVTVRAGAGEGVDAYGLGISCAVAAFEVDYALVGCLSLGFTQSLSLTLRLPQW